MEGEGNKDGRAVQVERWVSRGRNMGIEEDWLMTETVVKEAVKKRVGKRK